jgi:predicted metalloendopeptidase
MVSGVIATGGFALPRDAYLDTTSSAQEVRAAYVGAIAKAFALLGVPLADAATRAAAVLALETELAKVSRTPEQERDVSPVVHPHDAAMLAQLAPSIA